MLPLATNRSAWSIPSWRWLTPLVVFIVASLLYVNTLSCGFTWDDRWMIVDNPQIDSPGYPHYLFFETRLWRPLKRLSFWVDYGIWGKNPAGFHLTNLLLHAATSVALYAVARGLGLGQRPAGLAALLFAVHPAHVEAVANISHRKEPMACLFYLLGFLAYLRARSDVVPPGPVLAVARGAGLRPSAWLVHTELIVWMVLAYLAAMLSKEVAGAMFPVMVLLHELLLGPGRTTDRARRILTYVAPFAAALMVFLLDGYGRTLLSRLSSEQVAWVTADQTSSYGVLLLTAVKGFGFYAGLLVWPAPLYLDRDFAIATGPLDAGVVAGLLLLGLYLLAVAATVRRSPVACLGLLWYGVNLIPVLNVIPLTHWLVAERFVYVPSIGFAILMALGIEQILSGRLAFLTAPAQYRIGVALAAIVLTTHAAATVLQNRVWRSEETLWERTLIFNPRSYRGLYGYGLYLYGEGELETAERLYRQALALKPTYPEGRYGLARLLLDAGRYDEAIREARQHMRLAPQDPEPHVLIGNAELFLGDYARAALAYEEALARAPGHRAATENLAKARGLLAQMAVVSPLVQ